MALEQNIINVLPQSIRPSIRQVSFCGLEEIRLRIGMPVELIYDVGNKWLLDTESLSRQALEEALNYMTGYSIYAMEEELKSGYFTMAGGHRVGVTGRANYTHGTEVLKGMMDIGGVNIRIAHEKKGCAKEMLTFLRKKNGIYNTLLFAPPGIGKTTYLRDLIRLISTGDEEYGGFKVCVVDERSEIGACIKGRPQNDLGTRTDVLDGCPKELGMKMVLRSMSPQIIAVDELGKSEEFQMLLQMRNSGVKVLGTIHGDNLLELERIYGKEVLTNFERFIELCRLSNGKRGFSVYDEKGMKIWCSF